MWDRVELPRGREGGETNIDSILRHRVTGHKNMLIVAVRKGSWSAELPGTAWEGLEIGPPLQRADGLPPPAFVFSRGRLPYIGGEAATVPDPLTIIQPRRGAEVLEQVLPHLY